MKLDFTKLELKDIEGKILPDANFHKVIANLLYRSAKTLDLVDTARTINRGMPCEMSKDEIAELLSLINDDKNGVFAFARKAVQDYIELAKKKKD
ncbi:MAG: hypothetical protein Q7T18_05950 [Sedimentisphaerales bacterium]|nr:hypothetical protein [Sedimentisphaerales bacterium]